jgi:hypothetical protein
MSELSRDPERLETISRRNARGALLRHDWIHRWKRLLEIAGLPTSPGMTAREETMAKIAAGLNVP